MTTDSTLSPADEAVAALTKALEEHVGPRCPDFDPGCYGCDLWAALDRLAASRCEREGGW